MSITPEIIEKVKAAMVDQLGQEPLRENYDLLLSKMVNDGNNVLELFDPDSPRLIEAYRWQLACALYQKAYLTQRSIDKMGCVKTCIKDLRLALLYWKISTATLGIVAVLLFILVLR